jgi:2-polyprenyl-3-methyl-5-hydroxy-6-metoxy-1,4-benzoquinol methylase
MKKAKKDISRGGSSLVERRDQQCLYFEQITKGNKNNSNLTELNAFASVDSGYMEHNDWTAHIQRYAYCNKIIARHHPKVVIDTGPGIFNMVNYLWKNRSVDFFEYIAIDLRAKKEWFEKLKWKKGDVWLIQADLSLDHVELAKADLVISTEVFEHIGGKQQPAYMQMLYDMLKPGGLCIFSTPNAGVSDSTAENHKDEDGKSREWTYDSKMKLFQKTGFEVVESFGTFIQKRKIPASFWNVQTRAAEAFLSGAMFSNFAAAGYPKLSNNSLQLLRKYE